MTRAGRLVLRVVCAAAALLAGVSGRAAAQQGCQFLEGSGTLRTMDVGGGQVTYVTTPNLLCADGVRIRADSAVSFQTSSFVQLVGHVQFEDPERRLSAQTAEYYTGIKRMQAHGGSTLIQKSDSSVIRGDELVYEQTGPGRDQSQLDVYGGRPTARLFLHARDSTGTAQPDSAGAPYDIAADRIIIQGDSYFRARGGVDITREDVVSYADSVEFDQLAGTLVMTGNARTTLSGRQLTGREIVSRFEGNEVSEVEARDGAVLTSDDLKLRAPTVRVYFTEGVIGRLVAVGPPAPAAPRGGQTSRAPNPDRPRPVATASQFEIVGDSLDMIAPGQVLESIRAVGFARAESSARDSLNTADTPPIARRDWMEGDTIVATFERDSAAATPQDTAALRLQTLSAHGKARSLYRMTANDSARARGDTRPAIHLVTADAITLQMKNGEVEKMDVQGHAEGVHVEPARGSAPAAVTPPARATPAPAAPPTLGATSAPAASTPALPATSPPTR